MQHKPCKHGYDQYRVCTLIYPSRITAYFTIFTWCKVYALHYIVQSVFYTTDVTLTTVQCTLYSAIQCSLLTVQCSPVGAFLYSHLEHTISHSINTSSLRIRTLMQTQCLTKRHVLALVISILCIVKNTVHWRINAANSNVVQIIMQTGTLHLHRFKQIHSQRNGSSVFSTTSHGCETCSAGFSRLVYCLVLCCSVQWTVCQSSAVQWSAKFCEIFALPGGTHLMYPKLTTTKNDLQTLALNQENLVRIAVHFAMQSLQFAVCIL